MKSKTLVSRFNTAIASFSLGTRGESKLATRILLQIADEEHCTSEFLQDRLDIAQSTVSRTTRILGARKHGKTAHPHLVRSYPDSEEPRKNRYVLTEAGHKTVNELLGILQDQGSPSALTD